MVLGFVVLVHNFAHGGGLVYMFLLFLCFVLVIFVHFVDFGAEVACYQYVLQNFTESLQNFWVLFVLQVIDLLAVAKRGVGQKFLQNVCKPLLLLLLLKR